MQLKQQWIGFGPRSLIVSTPSHIKMNKEILDKYLCLFQIQFPGDKFNDVYFVSGLLHYRLVSFKHKVMIANRNRLELKKSNA